MPKKPPRNGYYYFMEEYRRREERAGRRFSGGMAQVAEAASEDWKRLTQAERDDFNQYAKENRHNVERKNITKSLENKYNSQGISFAQLAREEKEKEFREMEIQKYVQKFVESMDIDGLKNNVMYLIHVNIFCKTDDNVYYPAELAICKFNMVKGPIDTYHTFFDPGQIKTGYSLAVKEHSEKTHKITIPFVKQDKKLCEWEKIYDKICSFLELDKNKTVPLFTMYDDVFHNTSLIAVEKTLENLWESKYSTASKDVTWKKFFPVYPLPLLFCHLKNHCYLRSGYFENSKAFPNSSLATTELNKDTHNFKEEYACRFHQEEDAISFCSSSYVIRWARIICDHCCEPLGIDLVNESEDFGDIGSKDDYRTVACGSNVNNDDDDRFTDCESVVSGYSGTSTKTLTSERSIRFDTGNEARAAQNSNDNESTVWHGNESRQQETVSSMDNESFPALGGIRRGMRRVDLNK